MNKLKTWTRQDFKFPVGEFDGAELEVPQGTVLGMGRCCGLRSKGTCGAHLLPPGMDRVPQVSGLWWGCCKCWLIWQLDTARESPWVTSTASWGASLLMESLMWAICVIPWKQLPLIKSKEKHHCTSEPQLAGKADSKHKNITSFLEGHSELRFMKPDVSKWHWVWQVTGENWSQKLPQYSLEMTREEQPSSASSHAAAPQGRTATATEVWSGRVTWDLCSVPGAIEGIHQNPRASNWLLKRLQTSKYANSLIQHLRTYLKLDSFLSALMSGSQDNEGTQ